MVGEEHVGPLGVWISGAVAEQRTCWLKNPRYQTALGHILLSRLHLMEGTGLRRAVETQASWERRSCNATMAASARKHSIGLGTTENRHGTMEPSESILNNTQCGFTAFYVVWLFLQMKTRLSRSTESLFREAEHKTTSEAICFSTSAWHLSALISPGLIRGQRLYLLSETRFSLLSA